MYETRNSFFVMESNKLHGKGLMLPKGNSYAQGITCKVQEFNGMLKEPVYDFFRDFFRGFFSILLLDDFSL